MLYALIVLSLRSFRDPNVSFCLIVRFSGFFSQRYLVFLSRTLCDCSSRLTLSIASFISFITWNLSKVIDAWGKLCSIPDIKAGDMSQQKLLIFSQDPLCRSKSVLNDSMVEASFPSHTCTTFDLSRSINTETYLCPFALEVSSTPTDLTFEKSSLDLASVT